MKNYILGLKLKDTNLTRTMSMPASSNFLDFHLAIQEVFGWEGLYLHEFHVNRLLIVPADNEDIFEMYGDKFKYEDDVKFEFVMDNTKSLYYIYDLEDCWRVDITVLRVETKGKNYPQLLSYKGGMAKEDCGGAVGLAGEELEEVDKEYINLLFETAFLDMT